MRTAFLTATSKRDSSTVRLSLAQSCELVVIFTPTEAEMKMSLRMPFTANGLDSEIERKELQNLFFVSMTDFIDSTYDSDWGVSERLRTDGRFARRSSTQPRHSSMLLSMQNCYRDAKTHNVKARARYQRLARLYGGFL